MYPKDLFRKNSMLIIRRTFPNLSCIHSSLSRSIVYLLTTRCSFTKHRNSVSCLRRCSIRSEDEKRANSRLLRLMLVYSRPRQVGEVKMKWKIALMQFFGIFFVSSLVLYGNCTYKLLLSSQIYFSGSTGARQGITEAKQSQLQNYFHFSLRQICRLVSSGKLSSSSRMYEQDPDSESQARSQSKKKSQLRSEVVEVLLDSLEQYLCRLVVSNSNQLGRSASSPARGFSAQSELKISSPSGPVGRSLTILGALSKLSIHSNNNMPVISNINKSGLNIPQISIKDALECIHEREERGSFFNKKKYVSKA